MKKYLLLLIFVICLLPFNGWSASYYGCANANINADSTFCTTATGSCTGDTPVTAATALAGTHTLFANGCTITIPSGADLTVTAAKLSNKDDGGDMVDGGGFTVATNASYVVVIQADIETGGTTGAALSITGSAAGAARVTIGSSGTPVTITGGSASGMHGVADAHTVGETKAYANINGGSHIAAYGYYQGGSSGTFVGYGTATAYTGHGYSAQGTGTGTWNGDCVGSATARAFYGCYGYGAAVTITGSIIAADGSMGASGKVIWAPSNAQKYIKIDGGGTEIYASAGLGSDAGGTQVSAANTAAEVKTTSYFVKKDDGVYTQGTATTGGLNAYAF